MPKQSLSVSFDIFTAQSINLNKEQILGQITDLLAQHLATVTEDFDLKAQYVLLTTEKPQPTPAKRAKPNQITFPIINALGVSSQVMVGSPEWFELLKAKKFRYCYQNLAFTVRFETQSTKSGKVYHYWRAYCTINGKLVTRQIGKRDDLSRQTLDEVGVYFVNKQKRNIEAHNKSLAKR